jgi:D-arabinose 1-dehydrogenase-like Zn-dependent alcohol dehydrogenase
MCCPLTLGDTQTLPSPKETIDIPLLPLLAKGIRIQGSDVAPRSVYHTMLAFAAAQGIKPMIKTFPMTADGITQAFDELEAGTLRYRAVLVAEN